MFVHVLIQHPFWIICSSDQGQKGVRQQLVMIGDYIPGGLDNTVSFETVQLYTFVSLKEVSMDHWKKLVKQQYSSWSYDKTGDAGLFVQDSNMKCQDSGFAVMLTFLPREMMFECRTQKHASRVYCCILCTCTDAQCVV